MKVFSGIITLRKLCNHPDLVTNDYSEQVAREVKGTVSSMTDEGEEDEDGFDTIPVPKNRRKSKRKKKADVDDEKGVASWNEDEESYGYWRRSGKMSVVDALLKMWKVHNHRVLLFSQSKSMLNIFERFIKARGYSYRRMDGTTPISTRQPLVNEFNEVSCFLLLLLLFLHATTGISTGSTLHWHSCHGNVIVLPDCHVI